MIAVFDTNILPNAIILATARVQKAKLVTRNTKDFDPSWADIRVPYILNPTALPGKP